MFYEEGFICEVLKCAFFIPLYFFLFFSCSFSHLFSLSSSSFRFLFDLLVGGGYFYFYNDDLKEEKTKPI